MQAYTPGFFLSPFLLLLLLYDALLFEPLKIVFG